MATSPASGPGGGFDGGTVTNAITVDQGFGGEADLQEADVYLWNHDGLSDAELSAGAGGASYVSIRSSGGSGNRPIQYRSIAGAHPYFFYVNSNGAIATRCTTAPADLEIENSTAVIYLDDTPGATKLMVKAKDSGGTVRTAAIALT